MNAAFHIGEDGIMRFEPWSDHPWLEHGFTTVAAGDFRDFARTRTLAETLGFRAAALRQVHSDQVVLVDASTEPVDVNSRTEADALITREPEVLLAVRTADCVPILLLDPATRAIGAVHAGWRGSASRIVGKAAQRLADELGADIGRLEAVIGPCISGEVYEVGPEVAAHFDPAEVDRRPREHVDLAAANRRQLLEAGVAEHKIHVAGACTFRGADLFHSHRRDAERSGRMIHFIGIRESL